MAAGGRGRKSGVALVMRSENLGKEGVRVCRFVPARVGRGMVMAQEPLLRSKTPDLASPLVMGRYAPGAA
jgi:hypothetical protein